MSCASSGGFFNPYGFASGAGRGGSRGGDFPSPFVDQASQSMPDNLRDALYFCEYIFQANSTYRMAQERIVAYFLTDLEFSAADDDEPLGDDEKEKWKSFMEDTVGISSVIQGLDIDKSCYGNGFATLNTPFKRMLLSPFSGNTYAFQAMVKNQSQFKLEWDVGNNQFIATDPQTGQRGAWKINDQPDNLEQNLRVKLWSPHEIEVISCPWTGDCDYVWKIPADYTRELKRGNMYMLERAPQQVLQAVSENKWFRFAPGTVYHMKEPTLSGLRTRGWGLSRVMANFRDIWYVQVLRRYNEAIALDYVIPFRVITPEARGGVDGSVSDPLRQGNMGGFSSEVMSMIHKRRRNPTQWHMLPFPIQYQALGGDAKQLAPSELLDQGYDVMLNGSGTPSELYRGTLQLQTAPVSLRLFEATHHSLVYGNNHFLRWFVDQAAPLMSFKRVVARMQRVTHADDFNRNMAMLQLFMGQQLSGTSAFRSLGLDWANEQRRIAEEAGMQARLQAEVQEEQAQSAFGEQIAKGQVGPGGAQGGGQPGGGQPAPDGAGGDPAAQGMAPPSPVSTMLSTNPHVAVTPQDLQDQAESLATDLQGLPPSQRISEMRALKDKSEVLHALVKAKIESRRNRASTAGQSLLMGEQPAAA